MKNLILPFLILVSGNTVFSQGIGVGTTTPHASAALEVSSTTQGMLIPRMTTGQRTMIANPVTGLLVFDITSNSFWFRNLNSWVELRDSVNSEVHRNGPDKIYLGLTDNVGIGITTPTNKLDIATGNPRIGIHPTGRPLYVTGNIGQWSNGFEFGQTNGQQGIGIGYQALYASGSDAIGGIGLAAKGPTGQVYFLTNGVTRMTITGPGNTGIGTTEPQNRLDILSGPARTGTHPTVRGLYVTSDILESSNGVEFRHYNGTQGIGFGYNTIYATGSDDNQNLGIKARGATGNVILSTNGLERMRVTGDGRVGIGTTNPNATLEIARGTAPNGSLQINGTSSSSHFNFDISEDTYIRGGKPGAKVFINNVGSLGNVIIGTKLGLGNATPYGWLQFPNETDSRKIVMWQGGDNENEFYGFGVNGSVLRYQVSNQDDNHIFYAGNGPANSTELMRIKGNGNVGIGTTSPNAPLQFANTDVNRKIVLKDVQNNNHQFYGFGTGASSLRYQVESTSADHIFYAGTSTSTSDELFRIKGTGNVAIKGIIQSEAWQALPLINGWTSYGGSWPDPSFYKDELGVVHFRGPVKAPNPHQSDLVCFLPVGYRPDGLRQFDLHFIDAVVVIGLDGSVVFHHSDAGITYGIDHISFRAEQ